MFRLDEVGGQIAAISCGSFTPAAFVAARHPSRHALPENSRLSPYGHPVINAPARYAFAPWIRQAQYSDKDLEGGWPWL
jgi:hypothetical protein